MPNMIYILENDQRTGPLTEMQVWEMYQSGRLRKDTLCWFEGLDQWRSAGELFPQYFAAAPPPQAMPAAAPSMTSFEVIKGEVYNMPKITLSNAEVTVESGAMHYMFGSIQIDAELPSVGGFLKSALTKEKAVRPRFRGTGELYLEPTFYECNIMELKGEEWILDKGAFLACGQDVEVSMFTNKAWTGMFGGEGFFQTKVSGNGKLLFLSQGPLQTIQINGESLVVDGSFAVARTSGLEYKLERSNRKLFGSFISGEGLVNTFRGRGTVLIAPVPNRYLTLIREFGGVHAAISRIKSS
jgi:uncharacterized protein (TIGR00266 family)